MVYCHNLVGFKNEKEGFFNNESPNSKYFAYRFTRGSQEVNNTESKFSLPFYKS